MGLEEELDAWWALLAKKPADWELRLVFADWLEDRGLGTPAGGQRWQAEKKKHPKAIRNWMLHPADKNVPGWDWTDTAYEELNRLGTERFRLVFKAEARKRPYIWQKPMDQFYSFVEFASLREAEEALAVVLEAQGSGADAAAKAARQGSLA